MRLVAVSQILLCMLHQTNISHNGQSEGHVRGVSGNATSGYSIVVHSIEFRFIL